MVSKHKDGRILLPDPGSVFLLEGVLDAAGLVSPRKGTRDLDPLCSVGGQGFPVPCGGCSGVYPEALEWSKLLMEPGIPPVFWEGRWKALGLGKAVGSQLSQTLLLLGNAAGNRFGWMQIVQANKDEFSWDLCKREMSFFFSLNFPRSGGFLWGKTTRKGGFECFLCLSLPGAVQGDAIPRGAVRPSQGTAG